MNYFARKSIIGILPSPNMVAGNVPSQFCASVSFTINGLLPSAFAVMASASAKPFILIAIATSSIPSAVAVFTARLASKFRRASLCFSAAARFFSVYLVSIDVRYFFGNTMFSIWILSTLTGKPFTSSIKLASMV